MPTVPRAIVVDPTVATPLPLNPPVADSTLIVMGSANAAAGTNMASASRTDSLFIGMYLSFLILFAGAPVRIRTRASQDNQSASRQQQRDGLVWLIGVQDRNRHAGGLRAAVSHHACGGEKHEKENDYCFHLPIRYHLLPSRFVLRGRRDVGTVRSAMS